MHKALLLIKVAVILATFASISGTHASVSGQHDLLAQANDIALGAPSSSGSGNDDKKAILLTVLTVPAVAAIEPPALPLTLVLSEVKVTRPFARAPPATPHV